MRARWLACLLASVLLTLAPETAAARRVEWASVEVGGDAAAKRVSTELARQLKKATRRAKWGKGPKLALSAKVTKLEWDKSDDVLRVTLTVVAKIKDGQGARSHIRLGGRPSERSRLLRDAITIVAGGLVTRLADISRRESASDASDTRSR